jgi:hypothetical protein
MDNFTIALLNIRNEFETLKAQFLNQYGLFVAIIGKNQYCYIEDRISIEENYNLEV